MDRNFIVKTCNNLSSINLSDAIILIKDYCIENGKKEQEVTQFINALINTPLISFCLSVALEYYKKKFNIIELKQGDNILLTY